MIAQKYTAKVQSLPQKITLDRKVMHCQVVGGVEDGDSFEVVVLWSRLMEVSSHHIPSYEMITEFVIL